MSRLGKQPLEIPDGVEVTIEDRKVDVKGSKGTLVVNINPRVKVEQKDKELILTVDNKEEDSVTWGMTWSNINNALQGVSKGFEKKLEINGVGYKAQAQGKKIVLSLGYSHPIELEAPEGIEFKVEENIITVSGYDKQEVGEMAAIIRSKKKPEPYKGKGIKYIDEHIRRKAGKKAATTE
ncbi:50S ribosomal protein L6 [Patescibacteria group bacterium]|nr:50S ribosomal protein L6 [Patescibacteria group bacterium]